MYELKLCIGKSLIVSVSETTTVRCICGSSLVVETWWVHIRGSESDYYIILLPQS